MALLLGWAVALLAAAPRADAQPIVLDQIASGLGSVTYVTHAGDGSGRLFVVQQAGRIRIHDGAAVLPTAFLDITDRVGTGTERGLLSIAFHPEYVSNGLFYVNYTDLNGDTAVARFSVSAGDPDVADPDSEAVLLSIPQPFSNHNGGQLQFGPDGYLYIGMGDGGLGGDPGNRAQDLSNPLGKMLRIDIDGDAPYDVPPDNPFFSGGGLPEIWAYGLRNPWRFSFDRVTGDLIIADVGQDAWEEIDFQPAGSAGCENYGWRLMEGNHCFDPPTGCQPGAPSVCNPSGELTLPVYEYPHAAGNCSITGGYRYRGREIPVLNGVYVFGDNCSGRIWGADFGPGGETLQVVELLDTSDFINTFGEDEQGELYVGTLFGRVYRVTPPLRISPPTGTYGSTQNFDLLLSLYEPGVQIVSFSLVLDGVELFTDVPPCAVLGSLSNGGRSLRCQVPLGVLAPGTHVVDVTIETPGQTLERSATWTIEAVSE